LDQLLNFLDVTSISLDDWTIDVALQIRHAGRVLQWLTTAHRRILAFVLPSAKDDKITAVLSSKRQYKCDLSAQLQDLGGCRVAPGSRGKGDNVIYINAYTTDKTRTCLLQSSNFYCKQSSDLFPQSIQRLIKDVAKVAAVFGWCARNNVNDAIREGCARLEVRVPLWRSNQVLLDLPDDLVQVSTVSFDSAWW
jgi:hypothetical protein